jgi:hypothetical protein
MRKSFIHRLIVAAAGAGLLFVALIASSISVAALDPSIFTNNGCPVGNYACLQAAQPSIFSNNGCAVGNYACLRAAIGIPYYPYHPYFYPYPVGYPYGVPYAYAPPAPAPGTVTATIVSGRVVTVGQQVSTTVDGFTAGETVTASATGPNGQTLQIGSAPAASDGSVTVSITFPSAGIWQVTLHGQTSNKNVVNSYTVQ